jgi:PadR family transcriptional regulator PadR
MTRKEPNDAEKRGPMTDPEIGRLETEMNRGFLQILVLALLEKDMYGYSMVKHIEGMGYRVEENTLYPLLRRLEKNGWIAGKWEVGEDRPRKFYSVTPAGRTVRTGLLEVWEKQNRILGRIRKENPDVQ